MAVLAVLVVKITVVVLLQLLLDRESADNGVAQRGVPRILIYRYPLPARKVASADGRQAPLRMVTASTTCGYNLHYIGLQPPCGLV